MRTLVLVLLSLALASAIRVNSESLTRVGRLIPLHIPTQTLTVNDTFEVPAWLGAFYATVDVQSTWTLPLTIGNGGQTYPGEFLIIRNYGPADITLFATSPETIEDSTSINVPAGTTAEILSGYPNWVIVNLPNYSNQNVTADNLEVECWASIGTVDPLHKQCGDLTLTRLWSPLATTSDTSRSIHYTSPPMNSVNSGTPISIWFNSILNSTGTSSSSFTGFVRRSQLVGVDSVRSGTFTGTNDQMYFTNPFTQSGQIRVNRIQTVFTAQEFAGDYTFSGGLTGSAILPISSSGSPAIYLYATFIRGHAVETPLPGTVNVILSQGGGGYDVEAQTYTNSPVNWAYRYTEQTGAVKNTGIWANTNAANSGAGWCAGTAIDTCQYRGSAGRWTGDSGIDWYSEAGHFCAGTGCTAMSASNVGIYDSGVRVVRSCTAGSGITCSVTDGVLTVAASIDEQSESKMRLMQQRIDSLEARLSLQNPDKTMQMQDQINSLQARVEKLLQLLEA